MDSDHKFGLQLTVDKWVKKGVVQTEQRAFKIALATERDRDDWVQVCSLSLSVTCKHRRVRVELLQTKYEILRNEHTSY